MSGRRHCAVSWTTGTGPDDPFDTGVHVCALPPDTRHGFSHVCRCGHVKESAVRPSDSSVGGSDA